MPHTDLTPSSAFVGENRKAEFVSPENRKEHCSRFCGWMTKCRGFVKISHYGHLSDIETIKVRE
jgi:hypothetical protein